MKDNLVTKISEGKVRILREGCEEETEKGFYAPATITLIEDKENNYIIDPGCFGEGDIILLSLQSIDLKPKDITKVLITHNHPDHLGNIGLFKNATIYLPDSIFETKNPNYFKLMPANFYTKPGESLDIGSKNIQIISTPGHAGWDFSVLYHGKKERILIAGDLFWSKEDYEKDSEFLELCANPEMQKKSRRYIKEELKPELIIPGHGGAFVPTY